MTVSNPPAQLPSHPARLSNKWLIPLLAILVIGLVGCRTPSESTPVLTPMETLTQSTSPELPTPTRTRPARTLFIRPTLAATFTPEFTATWPPTELPPVPTMLQPPGESTALPLTATTNHPEATLTPLPTQATLAPTPDKAIIPAPELASIYMKSEEDGWGLTDRYILRTANGGVSWVNTTPGDVFPAASSLYGFFLDANRGWVVLPSEDQATGTLYRTVDGGNTWDIEPVPFASGKLFFIDGLTGWALADRGSFSGSQAVDIFRTTDAGRRWVTVTQVTAEQPENTNPQGVPGPLPYAGIKNTISFRSPDIGWVAGSVSAQNDSWLFNSRDGGFNWIKQNLELPSGAQGSLLSIDAPIFFSSQEGLLPVYLYNVGEIFALYTSRDGGSTWTATTPVPVIGEVDCVSFTSCRIWNGNTLALTEDGGQSWQQVKTNVNLQQTLVQIDFTSPQVGYALSIANNGQSSLYYTSDSGRTWAPLW
jgi:photosystem II stability/assembly factor-like uncharacterized protein